MHENVLWFRLVHAYARTSIRIYWRLFGFTGFSLGLSPQASVSARQPMGTDCKSISGAKLERLSEPYLGLT